MKRKKILNKLKNILQNYWPLFGYFLLSVIFLCPILIQSGTPFKYDWNWPFFNMADAWNTLFSIGRFGFFSALGKYSILLLGLPSLVKLSPELSLKVFLLLVHTFSGYGFYLFSYKKSESKPAAFIAGVGYAFSPYIFIRTIVGFNSALIAYAAIPFFLHLFLSQSKKSILNWLVIGLLLSLVFAQLQSGFLLVLILLINLVISAGLKESIEKCKSLVFLLVSLIVVNIPWLILAFFGRNSIAPIAAGQSTTLSYIAGMPHSLRNTLMLSDHIITRDFFYPFSHEKIVVAGFLLVYLIAGIAFLNKKNLRFSIALLISALVSLPFSIGPTGVFSSFYAKAYNFFPQLALFRETYHFEFIITFVLLTLFSFGLAEVFKRLNNHCPSFILIPSLAAMSILVIIAPYFTGDFAGYFKLYKAPESYSEFYNFARANKEYCKKAYYPPSLGFIYFVDDPAPDAQNSDVIANQMGFPYVSDGASVLDSANESYFYRNLLTSQFLEKDDNGELAEIMLEGGVDCLIVRQDLWTKFWRVSNIWRDDSLSVREKWMDPDMSSLVKAK